MQHPISKSYSIKLGVVEGFFKKCVKQENIEIDNQHAQSHHNLSIAYAKIGNTKLAENEMAIFNRLKSSN